MSMKNVLNFNVFYFRMVGVRNTPKTNGEVTVLLGAQWGDEGKGKVIDFLIGHKKVYFIFI